MAHVINKNDKILLTGGTGFLGKHIYNELIKTGYTNVICSNSKQCNLINQAETYRYLLENDFNIIIHCAGNVGGIQYNQEFPGTLCYDNLMMGTNLIEGARLYCNNLKKFILIGTTCSYPHTPPNIPFIEEDLWNGYPEITNSYYGISKKMLMTLLQSYKQQYDFPGITLIPTNMFGKYDNLDTQHSHVIPALIQKFIQAEKDGRNSVEVWGDGSASRDFLFANDCAEAIVMAMEKYNKSDPVNIGSGKEVKISELLEILLDKFPKISYIIYSDSKPNGQPRRCLNVEKAKKEFGFEAKTSLEEGLEKTIEWIRQSM